MKIKTIRLKKNSGIPQDKEREVKGMIIMLAIFAAGMIIGAGMLRNNTADFASNFTEIFDSYTKTRATQKIYTVFFNSLMIHLLFLIIAFVGGFSCIGLPIITILPFLKGIGTGMVAGYLFTNFAMSGIGYYLLTILPGAVIGNSTMLLACNCSNFASIDLLSVITGKHPADILLIQNYIKKYMILLVLSSFAALTDTILTKAFSYLFVL